MAIHYPKEQMHRIQFTKLTPEQILTKLNGAKPSSASELSDGLSGKRLKIVLDDGPTLEYDFHSGDQLSLTENGGAASRGGYGALELKNLVLVSHMVPGTQKGYQVIIDQKSNLATVFEVWFSGFEDNREVQRQYYFGYVDMGGAAPAERHHLTNRMEGKGLYWKLDNDVEILEFYPSVRYSSFVELTRLGGELMFCAPSDYVRINEHQYIYTRTECEFSGIFTLQVTDLFNVTHAGVRLGFNETDALEYALYRGNGEITGQLATFQQFGDDGETLSGPEHPAKGARNVYRPLRTFPRMTAEEVAKAVDQEQHLFTAKGGMSGKNVPPLSGDLVGIQMMLRYDDGHAWEFRFDSDKLLQWRDEVTATWQQQPYQAYEAAEDLYVIAHWRKGTRPAEAATIVLDMANSLTTMVDSRAGTPYFANEVSQVIRTGVIERDGIVPPKYRRHRITDELVGHVFTGNYENNLTSMHLYGTPRSASWIIFQPDGNGGLEWSSPANYVALRDDCYLFTWIEEACNGHQGTIVFNTRTMHDVGFGFHVGEDGITINSIGALARKAGEFDIKKYFGPKQG